MTDVLRAGLASSRRRDHGEVQPSDRQHCAAATTEARPSVTRSPSSWQGRPSELARLLRNRRLAAGPMRGEDADDEVALGAPVGAEMDDFLMGDEAVKPDNQPGLLACTSLIAATASVSPISTAPPGKVNTPLIGSRPRAASSTLPSRKMATLAARSARAGEEPSVGHGGSLQHRVDGDLRGLGRCLLVELHAMDDAAEAAHQRAGSGPRARSRPRRTRPDHAPEIGEGQENRHCRALRSRRRARCGPRGAAAR